VLYIVVLNKEVLSDKTIWSLEAELILFAFFKSITESHIERFSSPQLQSI